MSKINELHNAIAEVLATEKAYDLPAVCFKYGLENGSEDEAFSSKMKYVMSRVKRKDSAFLIDLALRLIKDYESHSLAQVIEKFTDVNIFLISSRSRRKLLDEISIRGNLEGETDIVSFVRKFDDVEQFSCYDIFGSATLESQIRKNMIANNNWDYNYLLDNTMNMIYVSDDKFIQFIEAIVHPTVRKNEEQLEWVKCINSIIQEDGYYLEVCNTLSGYNQYHVVKIQGGVAGKIRNIIFASDGPKPEIVFTDAMNNDIKIVKNEERCLIYDRVIPNRGLLWSDLINWWSDKIDKEDLSVEREFYKRLLCSLDSEPEKTFFFCYYKHFKEKMGEHLPALVPQVYLHYDPYTLKQLGGVKRLERQRMDFLLLLSNKIRIVIEIDGKQHYSESGIAKPRLYSEMVAEDRALKLRGYDVYRFGGYELLQDDKESIVIDFINRLFKKHGLLN